MVNSFAKLFGGGSNGRQDDMMSRFAALGYDNETLANSILAVLVGSTVDMSQGELMLVPTQHYY